MSLKTRHLRPLIRLALLGLLALPMLSVAPSAAADGGGQYEDLLGVRLAGAAGKSRLVIDAAALGDYKVEYQPQPSRVVVSMWPVSAAQAKKKLRPWLSPLSEQTWVHSVRSSWDAKNKSYKAILNVSGLSDARAFALSPGNASDKHRLVIDFVHTGDVRSKKYSSAGTPRGSMTSAPATAKAAGADAGLDALMSRLMRAKSGIPADKAPSPLVVRKQGRAAGKAAQGRSLVIVIDAGHGGKDPGALGSRHRHEKVHTLSYAKKLAAAIDKRPGMRAVLTRKDDTYITLGERVRIATGAKADLFISVHADSVPHKSAKGSSVYALSLTGATSKTAQLMADNANSTIGFGDLSLARHDPMVAATLVDLAQTASIERSIDFGSVLLGKIGRFQTLHSDKVQQANFYVLRTAEYPAVLVELAFISNPAEERKLASKSFRASIIKSVIGSIEEFFMVNPPAGSYFAQQ